MASECFCGCGRSGDGPPELPEVLAEGERVHDMWREVTHEDGRGAYRIREDGAVRPDKVPRVGDPVLVNRAPDSEITNHVVRLARP